MSFPVLRRGDGGADVEQLQGFLGIAVDGDFGPATEETVKAFQRGHGLEEDGVVGEQTWGALQATPTSAPAAVVIPVEIITKGFPRCVRPAEWAAAFTAAAARFPMFSLLGWACQLGKAEIETGGLTRWDENLNYSTVAQLVKMHGSRAGHDPASLLGKPVETGNQVYGQWGGYAARGGGIVQLTGQRNQQLFADDMGMTLEEARDYFRTIPGAAMTSPWYLWKNKAVAAANRGDMRNVMRVIAGKGSLEELDAIWGGIHGDTQIAAFEKFRGLLGA